MTVNRQSQYRGSVDFAGREIVYSVDFGRGRNMYLTVNPDCSVVVRVPQRTGIGEVRQFVHSRGKWILDNIARYESLSPMMLDRPYVHGAAHLYHGNEIRLDVEPGLFDTAVLQDGTLSVRCVGWHDEEQVGALVEEWFLERAMKYLPRRVEHWMERADVLGVSCPELRIGYMKRCWGTSSKRGWIHLNSELVKIAPECSDYVVVHELCHLRERRHNKRFYGLVESIMPDWRRRSRLLERYVIC